MKTRTKIILLAVLTPLGSFLAFVAFCFLYFGPNYAHQHCIKQAGLAFRLYEEDNHGRLPFSTNGYGDALLLLAKSTNDYIGGFIGCLCGPGDDGHLYFAALTNHTSLPEELCSRVYVQGLCETNDPEICILFDRNSCRGGDHFRSPWKPFLREACLLDGSMQVIQDENWPAFSRKQVDMLVAAGFSRNDALHLYPAAE